MQAVDRPCGQAVDWTGRGGQAVDSQTMQAVDAMQAVDSHPMLAITGRCCAMREVRGCVSAG